MSTLTTLNVGDSLLEIQLDPVSRLDLIKYAGASGDFNPIHTIDEEAEKAGLPGIIAHGMWTMGNLAKHFTSFHMQGYIKDYAVRFKNMVKLGDRLALKATLNEKKEQDFHFKVETLNQDGRIVISGNLTMSLY